MKKIYKLLLMAIVLLSATSLQAQTYFTDYGTYGRNDAARHLNTLTFLQNSTPLATLAVNQGTTQNVSPIYLDKTSFVFDVKPGDALTVNFNWTGGWMHNIIYVDWNNDGTFTTDASDNERIGYNAAAGGGEASKPVTYTVPASQATGQYRMRIMIDWLNETTFQSTPNSHPSTEINTNGGAVVDVILNVTNTQRLAAPTLSSGNAVIVKGDVTHINTPTAGQTVKYTTDNTDPATSATAVTGVSPLAVTVSANLTLRAIYEAAGAGSYEIVKELKVINATLGNEYYIVFQRYNANLALQDMGDGVPMQTKALSYGTATQLWAISKGSADGLYKLTSQAGNIVYWGGSNFTVSSAPATSAEVDMRFVVSPNTSYSGYEIQRKSSTGNGMNPIGGSAVDKNIGEWTLGDGGNVVKFMTTKDILLSAITAAQNLLDNTTEGTGPGQYPASARTDLAAAIATAQAVYDSASSTDDITAKDALNAAVTTYKSHVYDNIASTEGTPKWFAIKNVFQMGRVISTTGVATDGTGSIKTELPQTNCDHQLWRFEKNGTGIILINKATGMAFQGAANTSSSAILVATANATVYNISPSTDGTAFFFTPQSNAALEMHAGNAGWGYAIVAWDTGKSSTSASAWTMEEVAQASVCAPKFSVASGSTILYGSSVNVTSETTGATIHYTLDGTDPSTSSPSVTSGTAISITSDVSPATLKVLVVANGYANSPVASSTYTLKLNAPVLTPDGGSNLSSTVTVQFSQPTVIGGVPTATAHYTLDGTTPTTDSPSGTSVDISTTTTLNVIYAATGFVSSDVKTATYSFIPTGINGTNGKQVVIVVSDNRIQVVGVDSFEVYSISGQKVNAKQALQKGVYVVKGNDFTEKVIVK